MAIESIDNLAAKATKGKGKVGRPTMEEAITKAVALATAPLLEKIAALESKPTITRSSGKKASNPLDNADAGAAMPGTYGFAITRSGVMSGGKSHTNFVTSPKGEVAEGVKVSKVTGDNRQVFTSVKPDYIFR